MCRIVLLVDYWGLVSALLLDLRKHLLTAVMSRSAAGCSEEVLSQYVAAVNILHAHIPYPFYIAIIIIIIIIIMWNIRCM
jgi:hypothetical protein